MDSETTNAIALRRAIECWNSGDYPGYLSFYSPEVVMHFDPPTGYDGIVNFYQMFWSAFPGSQIEIIELIASGNRLAVVFNVSGRHQGEFMGIPATGKSVRFQGISVFKMANGQCTERWSQSDQVGLLYLLKGGL